MWKLSEKKGKNFYFCYFMMDFVHFFFKIFQILLLKLCNYFCEEDPIWRSGFFRYLGSILSKNASYSQSVTMNSSKRTNKFSAKRKNIYRFLPIFKIFTILLTMKRNWSVFLKWKNHNFVDFCHICHFSCKVGNVFLNSSLEFISYPSLKGNLFTSFSKYQFYFIFLSDIPEIRKKNSSLSNQYSWLFWLLKKFYFYK